MKRKFVSEEDSGSPASKKSRREATALKPKIKSITTTDKNKDVQNVKKFSLDNVKAKDKAKVMSNVHRPLIINEKVENNMYISNIHNGGLKNIKLEPYIEKKSLSKVRENIKKVKSKNNKKKLSEKSSNDCNNNNNNNNDSNKNKKKSEEVETKPEDKSQEVKNSWQQRKQQEFSSNWKQLIKSGEVKYNKKKTSSVNGGKINGSAERFNSEKKNKDVSEEKDDEIWFDDVDEILIEPESQTSNNKNKSLNKNARIVEVKEESNAENNTACNPLVKLHSYEGLTKAIAIDCEMVGVGFSGRDNMLARVSLVNQYGQCVYDKFSLPTEDVTDYRTHVSGIRPEDLLPGKAIEFKQIQREVCEILKDRLLVGHALRNDLKVLYLDHPRRLIRDTSRYKPFRKLFSGGTPSLKKLTAKVLGVSVQEGEHNSIQDAQAAMRLYTLNRKQWEKSIKQKALAAGLRLDKNGKKIIKKKKRGNKNTSNCDRSENKTFKNNNSKL